MSDPLENPHPSRAGRKSTGDRRAGRRRRGLAAVAGAQPAPCQAGRRGAGPARARRRAGGVARKPGNTTGAGPTDRPQASHRDAPYSVGGIVRPRRLVGCGWFLLLAGRGSPEPGKVERPGGCAGTSRSAHRSAHDGAAPGCAVAWVSGRAASARIICQSRRKEIPEPYQPRARDVVGEIAAIGDGDQGEVVNRPTRRPAPQPPLAPAACCGPLQDA
jgi:hypothetical protein